MSSKSGFFADYLFCNQMLTLSLFSPLSFVQTSVTLYFFPALSEGFVFRDSLSLHRLPFLLAATVAAVYSEIRYRCVESIKA